MWVRTLAVGTVATVALIMAAQTAQAHYGDPDRDVWATERQAPTIEPQWQDDELAKGYVVFRHSTLENLPTDYVPAREAILRDWSTVPVHLARGESASVFIGVHSIESMSLNNTWAEPTLSPEHHLEVEVYTRGQQIEQLTPGKVIERVHPGETGGFWLTFRAREDTPAGRVPVRLDIIPQNPYSAETVITIEVNVRPFDLPRARASFGAYYALSIDGIPMGWVRYMRNPQWREACYADMAAAGMTSVDFRSLGPLGTDEGELLHGDDPLEGLARLTEELARTTAAGLTDPDTPVLLLEMTAPLRADHETLAAFAPKLNALAAEQGWPELLIYTRDEPKYPDPAVRETNLPFRGTELRTVTSLDLPAVYGHGDVHDVWLLYGGAITPAVREEAERLGAEVWTYSCHIFSGQPLRNRFYAGLYTWAHGAGGNWLWAYYRNIFHGRLVWSESADYDLFPNLGYEGRRAGMNDYRYLQLLEDSIAANPDHSAAAEAGEFLEELRARMLDAHPHDVWPDQPLAAHEYDAVRDQVAQFIEQIGPGAPRDHRPWQAPGLRDEAAGFRGRSVAECVAGLAARDTATRRSAAWALYERGPQAAAATAALAGALADPEVRMPALRALEAIGPEAAEAVPQIAALMTNDDTLVRLGAAYALRAIPSDSEASLRGLRLALRDEQGSVVLAASQAVAEIGSPARALVPLLATNLAHPGTDLAAGRHRQGAQLAIVSLGPDAATAVPALLRLYAAGDRPDRSPSYLAMLAAIGPAAHSALPYLERHAQAADAHLPEVLHALFRIRGEPADLERMAQLLDRDSEADTGQRQRALGHLLALGAEAQPARALVEEMLETGRLEEALRGSVQEWLEGG